jgi:two-component system chemotaxis sensor kinase CheA
MTDSDIVKDFLVESYENLDRLDRDLVSLEKDPTNREILASVFRTIHTIKGTSGFLAFNKLGALTHAGESLLAHLRDGLLVLNPEITTALLAMVDAVRQMLGNIETAGTEGERNDQDLIVSLTRLLQPAQVPVIPPAAPSQEQPVQPDGAPPPVPNLGDILVTRGAAKASDIDEAVEQQKAGDPRHLGEILVDKGVVKPQDVLEALNTQQALRASGAGDSTIRVDVSLLDGLMTRVGELVLWRNQFQQFNDSAQDPALLAAGQRLNLLTTELQEGVMKTRMQPIGNVWSKLPRLVRDLALGCGKQINLSMEGKDTGLDKTIIEAVKAPLTHLVRNAVDHGIELPAVRQATGKSPEGQILVRAFHEGGQVHIEITDDGAGLDYAAIRNKALQKGVITADQAARITEHETGNLIFLPGLSTAANVTSISGRGVGMDVVKTHIEKIGGTVVVDSKPGQGCAVHMTIPLTLAIIPALIVTTAGEHYAIPQVSLLELLRLEGEQVGKAIEFVNGAPVHRLRGKLLPLVYLSHVLNSDGIADPPASTPSSGELEVANIVVLQAHNREFGLVVDEINDAEEIVVKPLSKQLKSIMTYSGATIMGDGKVALILDVLGLAQRANILGGAHPHAIVETAGAPSVVEDRDQPSPVLLLQDGERGRVAIDLAQVMRLEEFPRQSIELAGNQLTVQYRGHVMPLVRLSDVLRPAPFSPPEIDRESLQVVVYSSGGRDVGLIVDRILDITTESFVIQRDTARRGILGSAIIQTRITDVLDLPAVMDGCFVRCSSGNPA